MGIIGTLLSVNNLQTYHESIVTKVDHVKSSTTQNKEGILPVATLSIALYVLRRSISASDVAPEVTILSSVLSCVYTVRFSAEFAGSRDNLSV